MKMNRDLKPSVPTIKARTLQQKLVGLDSSKNCFGPDNL